MSTRVGKTRKMGVGKEPGVQPVVATTAVQVAVVAGGRGSVV